MTVTKVHTNFVDIPKPTLSQRLAVAAEEARTDGTVNDRPEPSRHGRRNGDRLPTISIASLYTAECVEPQNCGQCEGD